MEIALNAILGQQTGTGLSSQSGESLYDAILARFRGLSSYSKQTKGEYPVPEITSPWYSFHSSDLSSEEEIYQASVPEKLGAIISRLGLSKKGLSLILGVSRPTLYSWLEDASSPEKQSMKQIDAIYGLFEAANVHKPIFRGYIDYPLRGEDKSLFEMLEEKRYISDPSGMAKLLSKASGMSEERARRIEEHRIVSNLSEAKKDLILEDNLASL